MKRRILLFAIILTLTLPTTVFAQVGEPYTSNCDMDNSLELDCRDFSYTMTGIDKDNVVITKTVETPCKMEYKIRYIDEPQIVDTVRVNFDNKKTRERAASVPNTSSTYFSKIKTIKNGKKKVVELEYTVRVDLYSSGSFRSFYGADSPNLLIASTITPIELVNVSKGVRSATGSYPTDKLSINYSCNLRTTTNVTASAGLDLKGAGFSVTTGTNTYYYKVIKETGIIDLYKRS